jgi:hypothetical protein
MFDLDLTDSPALPNAVLTVASTFVGPYEFRLLPHPRASLLAVESTLGRLSSTFSLCPRSSLALLVLSRYGLNGRSNLAFPNAELAEVEGGVDPDPEDRESAKGAKTDDIGGAESLWAREGVPEIPIMTSMTSDGVEEGREPKVKFELVAELLLSNLVSMDIRLGLAAVAALDVAE